MKQKTKQLQSSGETRKTNRTWHFLSTLNSLLLSKLLLLLIIPAIGTANAWAVETTLPTSGSFTNGATKYELTNASTIVANNKIWWAARGSLNLSADYGMRPYQHAFALEVTGAATLKFNVKSNSTSARTITGQVYTAIEPFFNVWKNTTVGSSLENYVINVNKKDDAERTAEESAIHANTVLAGITSQKDANKKTLLCESASASIATAYGSAISHNCPTTKGGTNSFDISLEAGKYVIFLTSTGGDVGLTSIDINTAGSTSTLSSIAVKTAPTKTTYTANETFDPTGLVITKTMSNSSTEDVDYNTHTGDFDFSPSISTALNASNTSVTITYGGKTTNQAITVNKITNTLALSTPSGSMNVGDSDKDISSYITSKNNTGTTVTYSTSDASVATVSASGEIHAVGAGTATITASQVQTNVYTAGSATYTITVSSAAPSSGTVTITYMSSPAISYSPTGTGITSTSNASGKSNSQGHTLSSGQVITVSAGTSGKVITGITVTYDRYKDTGFAIVGSGTTTTAYSVTGTTGTWAGTANTITITGRASSSPDRIKSIVVTYSDGGDVTKHSVTYALNGGSGTVPTQADVAENASFVVAAADDITAPEGKTFMYWNDGTNNYAPGEYYTMSTSNVTLTAQYGYNITYTDAHAKGSVPSAVKGTSLTAEILAAEPTNVSDGYIFTGWCKDAALTTSATEGSIKAHTTLYANYKIDGDITSTPSGAVTSGQAITTTATGAAVTGMRIAQAATAFTAEELKNQEDNFIEGNVANWTITNAVSGTLKLSALLTDGTFYSDVLTNDFTVGVAAPVLTCANNIVTMTCATDGATIYYTTNGSTPTTESWAYDPTNKPRVSDEGTTFKAIAIKDEVSSAVTTESFAYTTIATEATLFQTDFTTGWITETISGASNERIINGTKVTFGCNSSGNDHKVYVNTSAGSLTFENKKMECSAGSVKSGNPKHFMAIHLTGVNGSITVNFGDVSKAWYYTYDDGSEGTVIARQTSSPGTSFTIENLKSDKVTLYLGQDKTTITELTITTPKTKLTANPEKVSFIGKTGSKVVNVVTNSTGEISIKTDPDSDFATISGGSWKSATKTYTMTVNAVDYGKTEVVMYVPRSGDDFPAKEITIPIEVVKPKITIDTAPQDITFAQNDAAEQKFTVAASTTIGGEVSYQWYTCDEYGSSRTEIAGAISGTYVLSTTQKATTGDFYYTCKLSNDECDAVYTSPVKAAVTAIAAGKTYNATVYYVVTGQTLTYTGLSGWTLTGGNGERTYCTASLDDGTGELTITGNSFSDDKKDVLTLTKDAQTITINVSVKKHKVTLVWSKEMVQFGESDKLKTNDVLYNGDDIKRLPYLKARLYEDGTTSYTGKVTFYSDDPGIAYFGASGSGNNSFVQEGDAKPTIRYGGGQGGCKFYAYIDNTVDGIESVKASYDLRVQKGYSNDLPKGRKVEVQQQYTLWKNSTDKLVTITYGGYKYNNGAWGDKTDSWGTAANYVNDKAIDGYLYAVRNKERDAADEYKHAIQQNGEFNESAWYEPGEEGVTAYYQRIKPFRLPCRASYITFTPHVSGTLTAYVYQNGVIGRGNADQLSSGPRLGYWFDEEGWVQHPTAVVTKQTIANGNARDKHSYTKKDDKNNITESYANMDEQMVHYWTNTDDKIIKKMLRSKYCKSLTVAAMKDEENYELDELACDTEEKSYSHDAGTYPHPNPYYWGDTEFVKGNNAEVMPIPEKPIPHQGGYMIVNEGYVKYTLNVVAGKTYYFFGKMTKVGYAGMNFVEAAENASGEYTTDGFTDYKHAAGPLELAKDNVWGNSLFGTGERNVIYDEVTVPSHYRIGKWNSICLPFAVNENQLEQVFGKGTQLAIYNGLEHDTNEHVYNVKYLRHVDQNILPGQPYLIYPTGKAVAERTNQENGGMAETGENVPTVGDIIGTGTTGNVRLTFHNVLIKKDVTAKSYGNDTDVDGGESFQFVGTSAPVTLPKYSLFYAPSDGKLYRWTGKNGTFNTYRAYMKPKSDAVTQNGITFGFSNNDVEKSWDPTSIDNDDDQATGIIIVEETGENNNSYQTQHKSAKAYNLMGQEIDPRSAKGIVIVNGKKVMY